MCAALIFFAAVVAVGCRESKHASVTTTRSATEALGSGALEAVDTWKPALPDSALPGARTFASSGCLACHTYRGRGSRNVGGSDLTAVGLRRGRRFFERFVRDPSAFGNDVMPRFAFPSRQLRQLAIFLAASKGQS